MFDTLPKDPMLLLSVVNTKLRDRYESLDALCEDLHISRKELVDKLHAVNYEYEKDRNQFV